MDQESLIKSPGALIAGSLHRINFLMSTTSLDMAARSAIRRSRDLAIASIMIGPMCMVCNAQAADANSVSQATAQAVDEVVVTARARPEQLLTTPAAITVLNDKALADSKVQDIADFIKLVPNMSVVEAQNSGSDFVTIRGISQVRNGQSPLAIVVDGVQQTDPRQFSEDLFNDDQIQILEGPQGALYGRNAIGGAVVITTKQPTPDFHAAGALEGGNGGDARAQAAVSGPIVSDKLLFRLSGAYHDFGGLLQNVYLDKTVDYYKEYAARAQFKAFVTSNLTLDAQFGYDTNRGGALYYNYQSENFDPNHPCFTNPTNPTNSNPPNADLVKRTFCSDIHGIDTRQVIDASTRANYTLPFATITNALGFVNVQELYRGPSAPYSANHAKSTEQWSDDSVISDDFRIISKNDQRLRWMVGGYILDQRDYLSSTKGLDTGAGVIVVEETPMPNNPINPTTSFLGNSDHNKEYSVFGDASFDITKQLMLEFGYRYDWNKLDQYAEPFNTGTLPTNCSVAANAYCNRYENFSHGQPKVTLDYKLNSNVNFFTDYGIGFRDGQYNQPGAAQKGGFAPGLADVVRPEIANTFEIGAKTQWLDGRLRLSATYFDTQDKDSFYFYYVVSVGAQILLNIDEVHLSGYELQGSYTVLKGLDVFGSYGTTNSTIQSYSFTPSDRGNHAPYVPEESGNFGAQYRFPIADKFTGFGRVDLELHGREYWDTENTTARSAFTLVNMQAGVEDPKGRWTAHLWVKNLFDKAYNVEFVAPAYAQPAEPRTFGAQVTLKY